MKGYAIILTIDTNVSFISLTRDIATLITDTKLMYPLSYYVIEININTHQRRSNQIHFIFNTLIINIYCNLCDITSFEAAAPSDHRVLYIYIYIILKSYLKTLTAGTTHLIRKIIISKDSDGVIKNERESTKSLADNNFINRTKSLQEKINKNILSPNNITETN